MQILEITVNNFGVFRGQNSFNFSPVLNQDDMHRPLVAIIGQNGVGKSTLFEALDLVLHGSLSLSGRVSKHNYQSYLLSRLHRTNGVSASTISDSGYVKIRFEYVQSGKTLNVEIKRHWERSGSKVSEKLTILCNGQPPDIDQTDYQAWINDLLPPGVSMLCFFDAEQLDSFARPEQPDKLVSDALHKLLGLDLVDKLQADLERYTLLHGGTAKSIEKLRKQVLKCQAEIEELDEQLAQFEIHANELDVEATQLETKLMAQESRLASEGSSYAARRPLLHERLARIQLETKKVFTQIEELSGELLPFCVALELCLKLERRLKKEARQNVQQRSESLLQERLLNFSSVLQQEKFWKELDLAKTLSKKSRKLLIERLLIELQNIATAEPGTKTTIIHNLTAPERERMRGWIQQALHFVPDQIKKLSAELRALQKEQRKTETELRRVPDDDALSPLYAEAMHLQRSLQEVQKRQATLSGRMAGLHSQREEKERQRQRTAEELWKAQDSEKRLALAQRSKVALSAYKEALARQRIVALEEKFRDSFNRICHKDHLLCAVRIDSDTFRIELHGANGETLSVTDLSAGERQLYALSLLWALRQVSGRQLPLAIDTPLARLDDTHRQRLVHDYFPAVSDQVLLFATDVELDAEMLTEVKPYLARLYELRQDAKAKESFALCFDQPKSQDVVLYCTEPRSKSGKKAGNLTNGFAQVWVYDADKARTNRKQLCRALLPAHAKRLVLIDPHTDTYNWLQVAELAKAVKDKYLFTALRNGHQIYNLWQDEWTSRLRQEGYDSIATMGLDGREEHVLNKAKLLPLNGKSAGGKN